MSQIKQKLRKIQQLAERGKGGEKETANRLLKGLLKKYNLTIDELFDGDKREYMFKYRHRWEKKLLFQIYAKVLNVDYIEYKKRKGHSRAWFELTPSQYAEVSLLFETYRKVFKDEIKILVDAFVTKHKIWSQITSSDNDKKIDEDRLRRIWQMAQGLKDVPIPRKRLSGKDSRHWERRG